MLKEGCSLQSTNDDTREHKTAHIRVKNIKFYMAARLKTD